ncbi:MAG TPA: HNH endonuclease [Humisphaera sp.]
MAGVLSWLKSTTNRIFDPQRETRIGSQAAEMWRHITQYKRAFNFDTCCLQLGVEDQDRKDLAERVYQNALTRAWADGSVDERERQSLAVVARLVHLTDAQRSRMDLDTGARVFGAAIRQAVADGEISAAERTELERIAAGIGRPVRDLVRHSFQTEGGSLVRTAFDHVLANGAVDAAGWRRVVSTAAALGLTEAEVRTIVGPQARDVVEQSLAAAKADGEVSDAELAGLRWMLDTFGLQPSVRDYVEREVREVNELARICRGQLPRTDAGGVQLRGGEILHYQGRAYYTRVRLRRGEQREEHFDGQVAVTDDRLIFSSPLLSVDLGHRRVTNLLVGRGVAEVQTPSKGAGCYYFEGDPDRGPLIYQVAIGRANQTITQQVEGTPSRHIPRAVRQRVWQAYGGKCADCGATDYLEYDHIIPHAKGGSNDEKNVQLLCRRCNIGKSDTI